MAQGQSGLFAASDTACQVGERPWSRYSQPLVLLFTLAVVTAYPAMPLYYGNQNTYFIHGLGQANVGLVAGDWLTGTVDPFPAFSLLVYAVAATGQEWIFHVLFLVLVGVYAYSLVEIVLTASDLRDRPEVLGAVLAALVALYGHHLASILPALGIPDSGTYLAANGPLVYGIAQQHILDRILQPSAFGVFLLASVLSFLRDRPVQAIICLAVACLFHSSYLFISGPMAAAYFYITYRQDHDRAGVVKLAALALALVLPTALYSYWVFRPTDAVAAATARTILTEVRFPHHALPATWFAKDPIQTIVQASFVGLAIYWCRGTRLGLILAVPSVVGLVTTLVQVVAPSQTMAMLFPWRVSVLVVPVSFAIVLARVASYLARALSRTRLNAPRLTLALSVVAICVLLVNGVINKFNASYGKTHGVTDLTRAAAEIIRPGDLVLIPPDSRMQDFRLAAGVPVFVDFKSHPYRDVEVIEWMHRLSLARAFYSAEGEEACSRLRDILREYPVTHVLVTAGSVPCQLLEPVQEHQGMSMCVVRPEMALSPSAPETPTGNSGLDPQSDAEEP